MSSCPPSDLNSELTASGGVSVVDRSDMPMHMYSEEDIKRMTSYQLNIIIVELEERNVNGHNLLCRECRGTLKSTKQSAKYYKTSNLKDHFTRYHKRQVVANAPRQAASFFGHKEAYILFRKNLLRTVVYNYQAFASCNYDFSVGCFHQIGFDPPCDSTVARDLEDACLIIENWVEKLFELIPLFSLEFDLWSNILKDAVLGICIYFLDQNKRCKLVLDTLPLITETTHDRFSIYESISSVLERHQVNSCTKLICMTSDGAAVNYATGVVMNTDIQRCCSHLLALLVKDICDIGHVFEIVDQCMSLQGLFGQSSINVALLHEFDSAAKIQDFSPTRWNNVHMLLTTTNDNLVSLKAFATRYKNKHPDVFNFVDFGFLRNWLPKSIMLTGIIDLCIYRLSRKDAYLGDVYHDMKVLQYRLKKGIAELSMNEPLDNIDARIEELTQDEYVQLSAFLNPGRGCLNTKRTVSERDGLVTNPNTKFFQPPPKNCFKVLQTLYNKYKDVVPNPIPPQEVVDITPRRATTIPQPVPINEIPIPDNEFQGMLNADVHVPGLLNVPDDIKGIISLYSSCV